MNGVMKAYTAFPVDDAHGCQASSGHHSHLWRWVRSHYSWARPLGFRPQTHVRRDGFLHHHHDVLVCTTRHLEQKSNAVKRPHNTIIFIRTSNTHQALHSLYYSDVIMSATASKFTGVSMVCSTYSSAANQRKHQSSASLAFVRGIHPWPVNSPHKGTATRKMFLFDDVIMSIH